MDNHLTLTPPPHIKHGHKFIYSYIVLLILAAIAGLGVHIYHNHHSAAQPTVAKNSVSTSHAKVSTTQYLAVPEWGVEIPLSSTVKDAYYTVAGSNQDPDGLPNTAWLGLASLNTTGCDISNIGPSANATPVGSIIRVLPTGTDPVTGSLYTAQDPNGTMIGKYYYAYVAWKSRTCASAATLQSIDSAFATATKSAKASN